MKSSEDKNWLRKNLGLRVLRVLNPSHEAPNERQTEPRPDACASLQKEPSNVQFTSDQESISERKLPESFVPVAPPDGKAFQMVPFDAEAASSVLHEKVAAQNGTVDGNQVLCTFFVILVRQKKPDHTLSSCFRTLRLVSSSVRELIDSQVPINKSRLFYYGGTLNDLSRFGNISSLKLNVSSLDKTDLISSLRPLVYVRKLSISHLTCCEVFSQLLQGQKLLTYLELRESALPDLNFVSSLNHLVTLKVQRSLIKDSNLDSLKNLPNLKAVAVDDCKTSNSRYLKDLSNLPSLKELHIGLRNYNIHDLCSLSSLKANLSLSVYGFQYSSELTVIANLPTLTNLSLNDCRIFDLKNSINLKILRFEVPTLYEHDFVNLEKIKSQLQILDITLSNTSLPVIYTLLECKFPIRHLNLNTTVFKLPFSLRESSWRLRSLCITAGEYIDNAVFWKVRFFPRLEKLSLKGLLRSADGLAILSESCSCLTSLSLGPCFLTETHLVSVASIQTLTTLEFFSCHFDNLFAMRQMTSLRFLTFDSCPKLSLNIQQLFENDFIASLKHLRIILPENILFAKEHRTRATEIVRRCNGSVIHVSGPSFDQKYC